MSNDFSFPVNRLAAPDTGIDPTLWLTLLGLLAQGKPVDVAELATATTRAVTDVLNTLAAIPETEYDGEGRIIGQGLTLRPTPHHFEINGQRLYTWCALDTLIFPALLGAQARIESSCHNSATPISLQVTASEVVAVQPTTAVVSLLNPRNMSSLRSAFCNQVHFFSSADAARPWLDAHPGGTAVPIAEAYALGTAIARSLLEESASMSSVAPEPVLPGQQLPESPLAEDGLAEDGLAEHRFPGCACGDQQHENGPHPTEQSRLLD